MTTENKLNVYQKLQIARIALQRANIKKSGKNAYAGFTYFELKDFIPTINELFDKYGLTSNFSIFENLAQLSIVDSDNPEDSILFTSPIEEAQLKGCTPIQALGAVHTYMKRYLYLNAFEIVEDDLLDSQAGKVQEETKYKAKQAEHTLKEEAPVEESKYKYKCSECGKNVSEKVAEYSQGKYGAILCMDCQKGK